VSSPSITLLPPPPRSPLCPYTTLFRSRSASSTAAVAVAVVVAGMIRLHPAAEAMAAGGTRPHPLPAVAGVELRRPHPEAEFHPRSEEHTSELQSRFDLVCRLLLEKKKH